MQSESVMQTFKRSYMTCKFQFQHLSKDILKEFVDNNYTTDDHALKCFLHCLGGEMNYMDGQGNFVLENIITHRPPLITEQQIRTKVDACEMEQLQQDACENAYVKVNCFFTGKKLVDE